MENKQIHETLGCGVMKTSLYCIFKHREITEFILQFLFISFHLK